MYHEPVLIPPPRTCLGLILVWLCSCADAHWASLSWPDERPGAPRQPTLEAIELGLAVRATAIDYEPDAVVVQLVLENTGAGLLRIERRAVTLAWNELEYSAEPDTPEPAWIELGPAADAELRLRYHLGRPLSGPGSKLILRSLTHDDAAIVELPQLELPAMPATRQD
ncbi:MAG TPA: hypothetical protein VK034_12815 [Enhygromyxa sp.]|nr:hypothetical protein [Enhygromyxa sp.]